MGIKIGIEKFKEVMVGILLKEIILGFGGIKKIGVKKIKIEMKGVVLGWILMNLVRRMKKF